MKYDSFVLENWLNPACDSEKNRIYLGGSCVLPLTVKELFELTGEDLGAFMKWVEEMNLAYPEFAGTERTRKAIAGLYKNVSWEEVILVHGGTGANSTVVNTLLEAGDNIISIVPNYQQFHSMPKAIGVEVRDVHLDAKAGYKLNLDDVRKAVDKNTKAIMFTNPNNPTGSLLEPEEMAEMVEIARSVDAYIVCDEMYRGLKEGYMPSFADIYEKAIVTASSSKIFSMAGTRVGWIVCKDPSLMFDLFNYRSYDSICGGKFDEVLFAFAAEHADKIYARSRNIVNGNKKIIDEWLDGHKYLHQYANAYGTTYLIHYDVDVDAETFCDRLLDEKGVLVCHGDCFFLPHTFRMTLSHAVPEELKEGLRLIDEFIGELIAEDPARHVKF